MAHYICGRCKVECFTTAEPHLCKDLRKRLERQEKAIALVVDIVSDALRNHRDASPVGVAEEIIRALAGRDLGD